MGQFYGGTVTLTGRWRRAIGSAVLTAGLTAAASALEPSSSLAHYGYDVWDSDSGLPQNSVTAIVQSRDGYLWLGTQEGLVRFDGVHFRIFDTRNTEALGDDFIQAICQTRNGDIWIGTADGLARYRAGVFTRMSYGDTFDGQAVFALHESADGALWIGSRNGVSRLRDTTLTRFWKANSSAGGIHAITEAPGGEMWFGGRSVLLRYRGGTFTRFGPETGFSGPVYTLAPDGAGGLWVGTDMGLYRFDAGRALAFPLVKATDRSVLSLYADRSGTLWVGTMAGLFGLRNGRLMQFTSANGLASDQILSILEDREGSLWVGTADGGLNRLKDQRIANFTTRDGLPDNKIWTVFEDSSRTLWVGSGRGTLSRLKPGEQEFNVVHDFHGKVMAMAQDTAGTLWVGTRDAGLFRMKGETWIPVEGVGSWISSICPVRDGSLWIAIFGGGVVHLDHGTVTKYDSSNGLPGEAAISIFEDRSGDIWIATYGGGLLRRHAGRFERFTVKDGLPHNGVLSIEQGADGIFWIGTRGGLGRYDGREFTTFRKNEGVFHDSIQRALDDRHGYLWLTTNRGVSRVSLAELNGFAANPQRRVHPVEFATANGMRGAECNNTQHGVARGADGRLWFATVKGLAMADPSHIPINRVPPQVVVEQLIASGRPVELASSIELPPERRDLEIQYTALSFRQPGALRFKYRLDGFDKGWIDAGPRRVAYYTNLPPGRYRFHVAASNEDGLWSSASDPRISFRISPHFYDTLGFRVSFAFVILLLAAGALRFHAMRLRRREGLRTELVEAKLDALRAQLRPHFLFNTFNAVLPYIDTEPGRAKRMILQLAELLRASLKSEPGQLVTVDEELAILEQYTSIERTRFGDRIQVSVDVDASVRSARVPSFLLQPLVENAIKHGMKGFAGPVTIRVSIRPEEDRLALRVQDNGRGLPDGREPVAAAGIGISNVRRRLEALYPRRHRFDVRNLDTGGCEASIEIPLDVPQRRGIRGVEEPPTRRASA